MNPPATAGQVAPGVRVTVTRIDADHVAPDEFYPGRMVARVYVNGLVAGKGSFPLDGRLDDDQATAEAISIAWHFAGARIRKWSRGVLQWDALETMGAEL